MTDHLRRALLVGVDVYERFSPLGGCVNDVLALLPLLARHEDDTPNFDCVTRETITRDDFLQDVRGLLAPGADIALLYFAGHGDQHGDDVSLCTTDGTAASPGLAVSQILGLVAKSRVQEMILVLDCCFSGAAGGVPQLGGDNVVLRHGMSILAASRGDQTAAEHLQRGVFTTYLCAALDAGAADLLGKVTVAGVYAHISELFGAWEQRPTFKANIDRLHELRRCSPAVPRAELRRIVDFFPQPDHLLPLDPSYEPDAEPQHPEHQEVFGILQRWRAAKLVEPIGHEHMYYAAMQSLSCRLTALGQHYWSMARMDRL